MMGGAPSNGRGRLGFTAAAEQAFGFLSKSGFALVRREATLVRFESRSVFVNVYHGRSSYQLGLELGRLVEGDLYSLHELLSAVAPAESERARCQPSNEETLKRCLAELAEIIAKECRPLLEGRAEAFEHLQSVVGPKREAATLRARFGAIIARADKAWEHKDYRLAAEQYEMALPGLDESRRRRLEYLKSRTAD